MLRPFSYYVKKFQAAYEEQSIDDYKKTNQRYKLYGNIAVFVMLVAQIIQEVYNVDFLTRIIVCAGILNLGLSFMVFTNVFKIKKLLIRQKIEEHGTDNTLKSTYEHYILGEHSNFIYETVIPFVLLFNIDMVDMSGSRLDAMISFNPFLFVKLLVIGMCFFVLLLCFFARILGEKNIKVRQIVFSLILVLEICIYNMMASILVCLRHQRFSYYTIIIAIALLFIIYHNPYRPFRIVWRALLGILTAALLFVAITDEIIMQVKPFQFDKYVGEYVHEKDGVTLNMYCEITEEGQNNQLVVYATAKDAAGILIDYDIRKYEIASFEMNKVFGKWYDYQGIVYVEDSELKDNALPYQVSFLKETIVHEADFLDVDNDIYMYQSGEIKKSGFLVYDDEIMEGEYRYTIFIMGEKLWLYGYLPFTEVDCVPEEVVSLGR